MEFIRTALTHQERIHRSARAPIQSWLLRKQIGDLVKLSLESLRGLQGGCEAGPQMCESRSPARRNGRDSGVIEDVVARRKRAV